MSDGLVNKDKVTIVAGDPVRDFWLEGAVNRYPGYTLKARSKMPAASSASSRDGFRSFRSGRTAGRSCTNDRGWD
jgi:hypothetical protein